MYQQQQQGFNSSPGGVPHNNVPAYPNAEVGPVMEQYLPIMSAKLYGDMASRGTAYTNVMAGEYARNGFINNLFEDALVILANYVEYSMAQANRPFSSIIDSAVVDCNNALLENQHRSNPQLQSIPLTAEETVRYKAAKSKMDSMRMAISQFLKNKGTNMNQNYTQGNNFQNQQPNNQQMNWQQQQYQQWLAQQQALQQAMQHQPTQMQQMSPQQQQQYQQWLMQQQQQGGHQGNFNPNQQQGNRFMQRMTQQNFGGQSTNFNNSPFHGNQQFNGQMHNMQPGFNPGINAMQNRMMHQQQQQYHNHGFGQFNPNNPGNLAVNTNQMNAQQQTPQPQYASLQGSNYDPMPTIDTAALHGSQQQQKGNTVDPFARNSQIMKDHNQAIGGDSFTQGASYSQPTKPNPSTSAESGYEAKVRAYANQIGLPGDESTLSYLEAMITEMRPHNGFISKKNAYSEVDSYTKPPAPSGFYDGKQDIDSEATVVVTSDNMLGENFQAFVNSATATRDELSAKSDKVVLRQPDGTMVVRPSSFVQQFNNNNPGVDIETVDVVSASRNPPYEFASLSMVDGYWTVPAKYYSQIKDKGLFTSPVVYPVYSTEGRYVLNDEGVIVNFRTIKNKLGKENSVDFEKHNDARFFEPLTAKDAEAVPDEAKMLETFVALQVEHKVADVLAALEEQSGVINGEGREITISDTIKLDGQVPGNIVGDDYRGLAISKLYEDMGEMDEVVTYNNACIRYKHTYFYPLSTNEKDMTVMRKLRYKDNYLDIADILLQIKDNPDMPDAWFTLLNDIATKYINHVVATYFPLADNEVFTIDSFCLDIEDVISEMTELGYGDQFQETAKYLVDTALYTWDNDSETVSTYLEYKGAPNERNIDDPSSPSFGIVRDVSTIPLHSNDVPLHSEKDKFLLTEAGFESLWNVADQIFETCDKRTSEVIIVTSDNRSMYLNKTVVEGIYAITKKSMFS